MFGQKMPGRVPDQATRQQVVAELRRRLGAPRPSAAGGAADRGPSAGVGGRTAEAGGELRPQLREPLVPAGAAPGGTGDAAGAGVAGGTGVGGTGVGGAGGTVVGSGTLDLAGPIAEVFPQRGLPRGGVVRLLPPAVAGGWGEHGGRRPGPGGSSGHGRSSGRGGPDAGLGVLLATMGGLGRRWSAVVGMPDIGWAAAAELGVQLDRVAVITDPGGDVLQTLSVLADGVEVIVAKLPERAEVGTAARRRILSARLRQHGAALIVVGRWPAADLTVSAVTERWDGIDAGHGRLRGRRLRVQVTERRSAATRHHLLTLSARRDGRTDLQVQPAPSVAAASDRQLLTS